MKAIVAQWAALAGERLRRAAPILALIALLALAWLAYWPGQRGAFVFDDYSNLSPLGDFGPIDHWWKVVAFLTSGFAGPGGRPIALASFLLDARSWPAQPLAFKLTNIALHLLNGALLAGLLHALGRTQALPRRQAAWAAVIAAGLWMLDPYWVSTTLYVVQRMAMLAAAFSLAGLWGYVHGRMLLARGRVRAGYAWMTASIMLGTLLATLSKENGALLPLLAWVLEAGLLGQLGGARGFPVWRRVMLVLPALLIAAYLAALLPGLVEGVRGNRAFTPGQRTLTEARIVCRYLIDLVLPWRHGGGLFNDDVVVSTGVLTPPITLAAILALLGLGALAWRWRRAGDPVRAATAAAIGFFLAGHVLESTWLQLELVFEHRNYLPAVLLFWPLGLILARLEARRRAAWIAIGLLAVFGAQTARRAEIWGQPFGLALAWAHDHPASPRAQAYLANLWSTAGNNAEAARLLDASLATHPGNLLLLVNRAAVACGQGEAPAWLRADLLRAASTKNIDANVTLYTFGRLIDALDVCRAFPAGFADDLLERAMNNPHGNSPAVRRDLLHRMATRALGRGQADLAYALDLRALMLPGLPPGGRLRFAAELAGGGHPELALRLLDTVPSPLASIRGWSMSAMHDRWLRHVGFYSDSESHLRAVLRSEIAAKPGADAKVPTATTPSGE